jgi:ABC-type multidrug transport system fused ATPase/permease subunit
MMFMGLLVAAASIQLLTLPSFVYRFWLVGVFSHVRLAAVKIIVGFFTVLTSMVAAVDAPFPPPFKQFVDLLHQDGIDGFSVRCNFFDSLGIKDTPFNMLKTEVFASFVFPIALALFIEAVARVRCCFVVRNTMLDMRVDEFFQRRRREILGQHRSAVGLVIYICVPISAMRQFAALDCISVGGYSLLRSDTLVSCESNEYLEFKNQMLPLLLTTLLVPIFCLVPLVRTRTKLNPSLAEGDDGSLVMYVRARDETIQGLRAFFQDYKPKWFFFDIIDIYRRVVLLGGLQLMEKWFSREAAGALFSFFCLLITAEIKPYARKSSNALSTVAHVMIVLLYSWAFVLINSTDVNASNHVMGFCFLSMSLVVIVLALFLASRSYRTARRVAWEKVTRTQRKIEYACGFSGEFPLGAVLFTPK